MWAPLLLAEQQEREAGRIDKTFQIGDQLMLRRRLLGGQAAPAVEGPHYGGCARWP